MAEKQGASVTPVGPVRAWLARESNWWPYAAVVVALFIAALIGVATGKIDGKDLVGWTFPLIGTFLGAFIAFRLQNERERRSQEQAQLDAINRTILTLGAQWNHLLLYRRDVLDPHANDPGRMLNVPAEGLGERFDPRLIPEELVFLAYKGEPDLPMQLTIEQGRFDAAREMVAFRCRLLVDEIQPLIEQHQLLGRNLSVAQVQGAFGERLYGMLQHATDQVYHHVPLSVESLKGMANRLHKAAVAMYPGRMVVRVGESGETKPGA